MWNKESTFIGNKGCFKRTTICLSEEIVINEIVNIIDVEINTLNQKEIIVKAQAIYTLRINNKDQIRIIAIDKIIALAIDKTVALAINKTITLAITKTITLTITQAITVTKNQTVTLTKNQTVTVTKN